jgi:diguanylate cyclase (GGDEF)-like protein
MVASRSAAKRPHPESTHGIPVFLDQIIRTLTTEQTSDPMRRSGKAGGSSADTGVGATATMHGRDLFDEGFTLEQVIRDYGDVCQAVMNLAVETGAPISADEFRTFNRCLDDAIAGAAIEYSLRKGSVSVETELTQSKIDLADTAAALSAAQEEVREAEVRALHDSLTGLPNRQLFDDRLAKAISLADRHDWTLAVMFLDLDDFKSINDTHGHAAGDVVLKEISGRLLQYVRDEDTVCRNGGDEFLYLLMNPKGKRNVERIANAVLKAIAQPVAVGDLHFVVKPSIGAAIYPIDGSNGDKLITHADQAMYSAKKNARGFVLFEQPAAGEFE